MTNEVKKCIALIFPEDAQDRTQRILKRLRNDNDKDHHNAGSLTYLGRCAVDHAAADLIESLSKQLDDQTVVIDRIYEQCKTLQNDLNELGFDSIADMYAQLEQVEMERDGLNIMLAQAQAMLETRTKERDAVVEDLRLCGNCKHCIVFAEFLKDDGNIEPCNDCENHSNWQWRGVQEVE